MAKVQSAMIELHDKFLWQAAAELLEIERLLDGRPQEVSANYDAAAQTCPTFADLGTGGMQALGVALHPRRVEAGIRLLAASVGKAIEREEPFLNLILPNGARFSACLPPASDGPTFSIRMHWRAVRPLADFIDGAAQLSIIDAAIQRHDRIVTVGATSAGKTTLLNAMTARLLELSPDERLGIIEDEPELQIDASNAIRRLVRGKADMRRHVREMLRMRPDRIIVGEVRGGEALDLLKAWNTGHSGFTTIHANSASAALLRLESLMQEGGVPANPRLIAESVDLLIFISRRPDGGYQVRTVTGGDADG
jgi:type IV secretion system protein TrbB